MIRIEEMTDDHIEAVIDVLIDTFSHEPWNEKYDSAEPVRAYLINSMNNNYFLGFVLYEQEKICGICIGNKKAWIKGMEYYIDTFGIRYAWQNKGIGGLFLEEIKKRIEDYGLHGIMLTTNPCFPAASFYEKHGIVKLPELSVYATQD